MMCKEHYNWRKHVFTVISFLRIAFRIDAPFGTLELWEIRAYIMQMSWNCII